MDTISNQPENTGNSEHEVRGQMAGYWREHSERADVTEMMLDNRAHEISSLEREEVLQYLPDWEGKNVLDLGAGIGRFTTALAKTSKSVIAVDFMESFIKKNRETNGHFKNVKFICGNVMDLELEEDSLDIIFSNWLFMYLEDKDIRELTRRMLKWLRPCGKFFFRESCYRQSGDKKRSFNPTIYRSPKAYRDLITSVSAVKKHSRCYSFDVVLSKPIETYIKIKNNGNQICWLLQSRDMRKNKESKTLPDTILNNAKNCPSGDQNNLSQEIIY